MTFFKRGLLGITPNFWLCYRTAPKLRMCELFTLCWIDPCFTHRLLTADTCSPPASIHDDMDSLLQYVLRSRNYNLCSSLNYHSCKWSKIHNTFLAIVQRFEILSEFYSMQCLPGSNALVELVSCTESIVRVNLEFQESLLGFHRR